MWLQLLFILRFIVATAIIQQSPAQGHPRYSRSRIISCYHTSSSYYSCCRLPSSRTSTGASTSIITITSERRAIIFFSCCCHTASIASTHVTHILSMWLTAPGDLVSILYPISSISKLLWNLDFVLQLHHTHPLSFLITHHNSTADSQQSSLKSILAT